MRVRDHQQCVYCMYSMHMYDLRTYIGGQTELYEGVDINIYIYIFIIYQPTVHSLPQLSISINCENSQCTVKITSKNK